ncbi:MAG: bifunctional phosphopantothenoylcysteine decarboxylase/phosphopantothenate--cysteine ligase CoaBC, partial [Clostridiaceae bacterium]|nr:bifunctional phosphopantothenoylcysteine decarboxylase/phosphopantothenate--cysteine ligase CoaBC [Clostridiaceae bacterium]
LFIEPDEGFLACNTVGKGRLKEPAEIVEYMVDLLSYQKDLEGINVLVTAGPTIEPIDPVRYITNHSSGKMGYEIARAAKKRGAKVTLVSGQTSLTKITGIDTVYVKTAQDMYNAVMENYKTSDIIVKSAAVADFTPENVSVNKIKKENDELVIKLKKTKDILSELGKLKGEKQVLVGFAMETENLVENAKAKLYGKNLDMIVANNLNDEGAGFRVDTNKVVILTKDEELDLPLMEKERLAHIILDNAKKILNSKKG